jgi:hypothetical protein
MKVKPLELELSSKKFRKNWARLIQKTYPQSLSADDLPFKGEHLFHLDENF